MGIEHFLNNPVTIPIIDMDQPGENFLQHAELSVRFDLVPSSRPTRGFGMRDPQRFGQISDIEIGLIWRAHRVTSDPRSINPDILILTHYAVDLSKSVTTDTKLPEKSFSGETIVNYVNPAI
jgi:hypothetical protein